jgi:hypothetical protein
MNPVALGDILTGLLSLVFLFFMQGSGVFLPVFLTMLISMIGFSALFICSGSLAFFIPKGSYVGILIVEITLAMSGYPIAQIFSDRMRMAIFLTPAAITTFLPMQAYENPSLSSFFLAFTGVILFFLFAVKVYHLGVKRYQSISLVGARSL